ncbi:MAG TPA: hypothetical protein VNT75_18070 [Symbiobacteriaceae bacterium]|nr:hypothetical protein [Symbiobacteriaceae bacterium]
MTYVIYALWFLSLLGVAGELDRRWGRWLCERILPELTTGHVWFLPPAVSVAVPGAGQLLNGQPVKALLCFLWPFIMTAIPRPWQFVGLKLWWMAAPWYAAVFLDALIVGLARFRSRRACEREDLRSGAQAAHDLHAFLTLRSERKPED